MLIDFTVGNFRSFRDKATMSLQSEEGNDHLAGTHVVHRGDKKVLKSAAAYGINSGGKTNFLRALRTLKLMVLRSNPRRGGRYMPPIQPFSLSVAHANAPTYFQINFCLNGVHYRYGLEADSEHISSEWLSRTVESSNEEPLFHREDGEITVSDFFPEGKDVVARTDADVLFLSAVSGWNGGVAKTIEEWFSQWRTMVDLSTASSLSVTSRSLEDEHLRDQITELAKAVRLGFDALELESQEEPARDPFEPSTIERRGAFEVKRILTHHSVYDDDGKKVHNAKFDLATDESTGTRKFISLCTRFLPALEQGGLVLVDELEAWMHPGMTRQLLALFHSSANRGDAQLLFATHDTHLLHPDLLRRDQIWFVDKDEAQGSFMQRASDYEGGPDDDMEREYLLGLFGAIPPRGIIEEKLRQ